MSASDQDENTPSPSGKRRGGEACYAKHGTEHMRKIGARGTATVQDKYGLRFYSEIARRKRGAKRAQGDAA